MQTKLLTKRNIATIGEEITHELGAELIKNYQQTHPTDAKAYIIGKDIVNQILAQPGCVGIQFYNAINEFGKKTLVYVGLDENEKPIVKYSVINSTGAIEMKNGLIGDRLPGPTGDGDGIFEGWDWIID